MRKLDFDYVQSILDDFFKQTETGFVKIGNEKDGYWHFYISLSNSLSVEPSQGEQTVVVRDKNQFVKSISEYLEIAQNFYESDKDYYDLDVRSFHEKLIMDLFVNATNFDFNNIEEYILNRTKMISDKNTQCGTLLLGEFNGCEIVANISKNHSYLEGPYKFNVKTVKDEEKFVLPSITFGRIDDKLFLYAIQRTKEAQANKLSKQMDRLFRKANKGVDMEDEILSQISTNALVSLVVFLAHQQEKGITQVEGINFMPVRYDAQLTKDITFAENEQAETEMTEKHNKNQFNITNKFTNTIMRYAHHFGLSCEFDDIRETIVMSFIKNGVKLEKIDNIVHEIDEVVRENINSQTKGLEQ